MVDSGGPAVRRRRWLLLGAGAVVVAVVVGAAGYAASRFRAPGPVFRPLAVDTIVELPDLAPDGHRQVFVSESAAYAVGQRADGRIGVSRAELLGRGRTPPSTTEPHYGGESHVTPVPARLRTAALFGDWLVVDSEPGTDGTRVLFVVRGRFSTAKVIGRDDRVVVDSTSERELGLFWVSVSPVGGVVRRVTVGVAGNQAVARDGPAYRLPPGTRVAHRSDRVPGTLLLVEDAGALWRFSVLHGLRPAGRVPLPAGHPPGLAADLAGTDGAGTDLLVAEDRPGYRVTRGATEIFAGPADRRPVWVGRCGLGECVVDERPGDPASRELTGLGPGGVRRVPVPHAAPGDHIARTGGLLLVPTADGARLGTTTVDGAGRAVHRSQRLVPVGSGAVVTLPATPARAAQAVAFDGVELPADRSTRLGEPVVRSAGCTVAWGRLACPGETHFWVWHAVTEVPYP